MAEMAQASAKPQAAQAQSSLAIQRKCGCNKSSDDERTLQRSARDDAREPTPPLVHDALSSSGEPLELKTRGVMERMFGYDFGNVRVHADSAAAESARAVNATAYTTGRDVVFGSGAYAPHSAAGRELIAHELTHVVQQARGPVSGRAIGGGVRISDPGDAFERQADAMAAKVNGVVSQVAAPARLNVLAPALGTAVQRRPAAHASRGAAIVADNQRAGTGQMRKSEFLTTLRDRLMDTVDAEFRPHGRSGRDCPYILRTIALYANRSVESLMRLIRAYAHPSASADVQQLIAAVVQRTRTVARRIAARQFPFAQAMTETPGASLPSHDPGVIRSQLGPGQALDATTRSRMERSFGATFASVRVHDDSTASRFSTALGARAFTIGQDIAFGSGQYVPGTPQGRRLIAHELAHTIQQGGAQGAAVRGPEPELEHQADRAASAALDGEAATPPSVTPGLRLQRAPVVLAGALIVAEATPEIIVVGELGADVVLVDGAVTVTADVAAPAAIDALAAPAIEATTPMLEAATPAIEATAPATSSFASTAVTATVGVGAAVGLSSDSPQTDDDQQKGCNVYPLGYHRGTNTNGHHDCADLRNIYPGSDVQVDSPVGNKAFDALDASGTLWEIKTDQYTTWNMPDFIKDDIVARDALELERERLIATACGYPFLIGITDPGYATALLAVDRFLPAVSISC
ncbi:MAG: DUF4157 domain-containing protein [Deltaproteobacteria bacterium]